MYIAFTGHRNTVASNSFMERLALKHPDAIWMHGAARGFDTQVRNTAIAHGIAMREFWPDYQRHGHDAPLVRNREMVDLADIIVACYDGRDTGGTAYTIRYARAQGKRVHIVRPAAYLD